VSQFRQLRDRLRLDRAGHSLTFSLKAPPEVLQADSAHPGGCARMGDPTEGQLLGSCLTFKLALSAASAGEIYHWPHPSTQNS
jgi:hypothetical protein